jgi:CBS domain-containing protein
MQSESNHREKAMNQRTIRDVISQRPLVSSTPQQPVRDAALLMGREHVGALPVLDNGRLVGIFTERDALCRVLACCLDPSVTSVGEVMTRTPQTIDPDRPLAHALIRMYEGGFRHLPVIEEGRLLGVVSARDALGPELTQVSAQMQEMESIAAHMR